MYYRRYYRKYYKPKNPPATAAFQPILEDLKQYFFSLSYSERELFFANYREQYGDSAYNYAINKYDDWKDGITKLSSKTLLKLVETLPICMDTNKKIELLNKLISYHKKSVRKRYRNETWLWTNYRSCCDATISFIKQNYSDGLDAVLQSYKLPDAVSSIAVWISNDDMEVAKHLIGECLIADYQRMIKNAVNDLLMFRNKLAQLQQQGQVYQTISLNILLPTLDINITVPETKKTFMQKFMDLW